MGGFAPEINDRASAYTLFLSGEYLHLRVEDERPNSGSLGNPNMSSRDAASDYTRSLGEIKKREGLDVVEVVPSLLHLIKIAPLVVVCPAHLTRY